MKRVDAKQVIMISDLHFGVHSNSQEWMDIQKQYYYEWFIPKLKELKKKVPETILLCLGDVFENRTALNVSILNEVMGIFSVISKILPVHIILGNHDTAYKNSNEIHSLKPLALIDNIFVYEQPDILQFDSNKKAYLMPWRVDKEQEKESIEEAKNKKCNYLFCHADFLNVKYNKFTKSSHGNSIEDYAGINRVFSGHIHWRQELDNLTIVGNPFQMNKGDKTNVKGIYVLNTKTDDVEFIPNKLSPRYITLKLVDVLEMSVSEYLDKVRNNFVEITFTKEFVNFPFYKFTDEIKEQRALEFKAEDETVLPNEDDLEELELGDYSDLKKFNLLELTESFIEIMDVNNITKEKLRNKITDLFNQTIKDNKEVSL